MLVAQLMLVCLVTAGPTGDVVPWLPTAVSDA